VKEKARGVPHVTFCVEPIGQIASEVGEVMRGLNTIFESLLIAPRELASTSNLNLSGIKMRTTLAVKTIDVKSWLNNIISKTEG